MGIETIFANMSCSSLETRLPWYERLFGTSPTQRPMDGLAEWHFTDSAEVQLHENKANAGKSTLTIGVLPIEPRAPKAHGTRAKSRGRSSQQRISSSSESRTRTVIWS